MKMVPLGGACALILRKKPALDNKKKLEELRVVGKGRWKNEKMKSIELEISKLESFH